MPCSSGKKGYRDRIAAELARSRWKFRSDQRQEKAPVRSYQCHQCHAWHHTSMTREEGE